FHFLYFFFDFTPYNILYFTYHFNYVESELLLGHFFYCVISGFCSWSILVFQTWGLPHSSPLGCVAVVMVVVGGSRRQVTSSSTATVSAVATTGAAAIGDSVTQAISGGQWRYTSGAVVPGVAARGGCSCMGSSTQKEDLQVFLGWQQ
ncbi:hypothetical protein H1C71_003764, partial [Ictidomys tridecemlineatus]